MSTHSLSQNKVFVNISLISIVTALAVAIGPIFHIFNLNVFVLLPMHWVVISSSIIIGWKRGAIVAILTPIFSFLVTGMPVLPIAISMIFELLSYAIIPVILLDLVNKTNLRNLLAPICFGLSLFIGRLIYFGIFTLILNKNIQFQSLFRPAFITIIFQIVIFSLLYLKFNKKFK